MTQNNIRIAITGGIGSGKSAVCKIIEEYGLPVFSCDEIYSDLISDIGFLKVLEKEFGSILNKDNTLNKEALADKVFNDAVLRSKLNEITHPIIMDRAFKIMSEFRISFLEVPLLFEGGFEGMFDDVIVVLREKEDRINSVVTRDKIEREHVVKRINSQISYENYDFAKYYVIHNNEKISDLKRKVIEILKNLEFRFNEKFL